MLDAMARTARVALLQLPAFGIGDAAASLAHTLRRIDEAARERPDIIALPEGTYPAYFLGSDALAAGIPTPGEAAERIAAKAREHRLYIAAGMALDAPGGGYTNGAALFGRDGSLVGRYDKSFLWHFDARWFRAGNAYPTFDTDFGRIGMLVCADGRLPEIARCLAVDGAQLILDLTAWVSTGRRPEDLTTVQREYLMPLRAAENGVWIAAADKFGVEAGSIVYCGRSCVIDPTAAVVASLGPDEEDTLVYDVPIGASREPVPRRPELYETLTHQTESLPVVRTLGESAVFADEDRRIAAVQMPPPRDGAAFVELVRAHLATLALQDVDLVVFPAVPPRLDRGYDYATIVGALTEAAVEHRICIAVTLPERDVSATYRTAHLFGPHGPIGMHRQTHKPASQRHRLGDVTCPVLPTPVGRVGLLAGAEGFVPEVARSLMLRGAEILLWSAADPPLAMLPFARARADENRVSLACAAEPSNNGAAAVIDPSGRVLAVALEGRELAVSATVNRLLSHAKEMAPGTDVVRGRQPETYRTLLPEPSHVGTAVAAGGAVAG
jgi:predicted amidohydrolase